MKAILFMILLAACTNAPAPEQKKPRELTQDDLIHKGYPALDLKDSCYYPCYKIT
jgi:hypothetical protein